MLTKTRLEVELKKYWYYEINGLDFTGFFHLTAAEARRGMHPAGGPFDTFAAAKKDAIEYFKCDLDQVKLALLDIRHTLKKDVISRPNDARQDKKKEE